MAKIFSLFGEIFIDNEKANKSIEDTTNKGKNAHTSFAESAGNIAKKATAIGTAIAGASTAVVGGISAMATKTSDYADKFDKASLRTGIAVEDLQRLNYAAGQSGISLETVEKSAKKLSFRLGEVSEGNKTTIAMFEKLGVSVTDSNGNLRSSSDVYNDTIKKLADMGDTAQATAVGTDLFGKAFTDMKPLLAEGSDGIQELEDRADSLGIVMGKDAVDAGVKLGDTMEDIKQSLAGSLNKAIVQFMPVLQQLLDKIIENIPKIQATIDKLQPTITKAFNIAMSVVTFVIKNINIIFPLFVAMWGTVIALNIPKKIVSVGKDFSALFKLISSNPIILVIGAIIVAVGLLIANWDKVKKAASSVKEFVCNVFNTMKDKLSNILDGVKNVFSNIFGGLIEVVKAPINFIIDGINVFIAGLNKIKIPDWVAEIGGKGINIPLINKLKVGIDYVPYDEMPALLHKGERVLTADENENLNKKESGKVVNYYNSINIEKLEVKEKEDINRIAEELHYLELKEV